MENFRLWVPGVAEANATKPTRANSGAGSYWENGRYPPAPKGTPPVTSATGVITIIAGQVRLSVVCFSFVLRGLSYHIR